MAHKCFTTFRALSNASGWLDGCSSCFCFNCNNFVIAHRLASKWYLRLSCAPPFPPGETRVGTSSSVACLPLVPYPKPLIETIVDDNTPRLGMRRSIF